VWYHAFVDYGMLLLPACAPAQLIFGTHKTGGGMMTSSGLSLLLSHVEFAGVGHITGPRLHMVQQQPSVAVLWQLQVVTCACIL
jgi:hypothetical protein